MTTSIQHPKGWALRIGGGIALLLALFALSASAQAQSQSCFLVADNIIQGQGDEEGGRDGLGVLLEGEVSPIGLTNTRRIEAIAYDNTAEVLYATDEVMGVDGLFGSLDTETGAFSAIGAVGCGDGANGTVCFDDIDGLAFDPAGTLYGTVRLRGEGVKDVLIQIDPATGAFIPDAFGPGVDYVTIEPAVSVPLDDIDDIAFAPDGTLYGILNEGSAGFEDRLVRIDPATGEVLSGRTINVDGQMQRDIEGLTFDADGRMLGVQGGEFRNVYVIDPATGDATLLVNITRATDYEAIDCVVPREDECRDLVTEDCITVELLGVTLNADGTRSYNFKVTSDCDRGLSFLAFELPEGAVAINPSSTAEIENIENPGGTGGPFNPSYRNLKFELGGDFKGGDMATFSYTLAEDAAYNGDLRIRAKYSTTVTDLTISLEGCPMGEPPPEDCVECGTDTPGADSADKVSELTLEYTGDVAALVEVYNDKDADEDELLFRGTLQPGDTFTIRASDVGEDKFNNDVGFFIDGVRDTKLHTSCSRPLGPGTVSGQFTVIAGKDKQGRPLCPDDPSSNCDCDGGVKELTMAYDGDGPAWVTVYNDKNADEDKILFDAQVQPGEEFTIRSSTLDEDKFKSNISFYIEHEKVAELHTSCSQPIGSGQEVGPFTIVSGVDKMGNELCPFSDSCDDDDLDGDDDCGCDDDDLDGDDDCDDGDDAASRGIPTEFEVAQAYPNPFSRATTIGISLPEAAPVQVVVYDVQGRLITTLVDAELAAGQHLVDFEAGGLAPGMYLYRVVTPLGAQGGKVMLLK